MKILIADDTDSVSLALRLALEYLGHEVVGMAPDGVEALAQYQAARPDLVVMDVRMPRMDGFRCTELIRQADQNARVLMVTGGRTTADQAREAGARGLVEKPFDLAELGDAIAALA
jgi:CheY-like chemotaxis protein